MGALQNKFLKQDALGLLWDNETITADDDSAIFDFAVDGGCPEMFAFIKLGGIATGESVDILIKEAYRANLASFASIPLRLRSITANGEYVVYLDNNIVQGQKLKLHADITVATGGSVVINGYLSPKRVR